MAEEQKEIVEGVEGAEGEAKKKSPIPLILILLAAVLALGGGGYFAYMKFFQEETLEEPMQGEEAQQEEPALGVMFALDPFLVNLAGSQGKRVLKVTVSLELSAPEVHAELTENLQKVVDSILVLLSSKTFEDVYSVQGKFKLKDEITTRVNRFLVMGHIKDAYFTEFIIQ